jgi:hypothetical protein
MISQRELEILTNKFPDYPVKIVQLYNNDSIFRSLCDDYFLSVGLLIKLESDVEANTMLKIEYTSICGLLEQELNEYLENGLHPI